MSVVEKRGVLTGVNGYGIVDTFTGGELVVDVRLDGTKPARYIPRIGFKLCSDVWRSFFENGINVLGQEILDFDPDAHCNRGRKFSNDPFLPLIPFRLYDFHEVLFNPAIGDEIEIAWDYSNFNGKIYKLALDRNPIPNKFKIGGNRAAALDDIYDSVRGKG